MAVQNLVSAVIPEAVKASIIQKIGEIKTDLSFLITLQPDEIQGLFKAGNIYSSLIERAYTVAGSHPEILPSIFNVEEFKKDYVLSKDLADLSHQVNELAQALDHTLLATRSDSLAEALEVYAAVQQNKDKVPGLNSIADEMAEFFKKTIKKKPEPVK